MQNKNNFHLVAILAVALCAGFCLWAYSAARAMAPLVVQYPKDGSELVNQPLYVSGIAPVNTKVYVTLDGTYLGSVFVNKPKSKSASTTTYKYLYKGKRLAAGAHSVEVVAQTLDRTESSNTVINAFTVPDISSRTLDGVLVKNATWNLVPYAIMIENTPAARPQAGLSQASIVYETLAEGGVTRFEAIFPQTVKPKVVGPVRSSRPYYVDWASEYQAMYLHAGGSRDALNEIGKLRLRSFDALTRKYAKYTIRKCYGVHCLFTTNVLLDQLVKDAKLTTTYTTMTPWQFKDGAALTTRGANGKKLTINFNGKTYKVEWKYDKKANRYLRWNGGVVAKDKNTGKQLAFTNVIVQRIGKEKVLDKKGRLSLPVVGKGNASLYRDGQNIPLRWEKKSASARTLFYLKGTNTQVQLNRGNTWVEVVPGTRSVTFK